MIRIGLISDTHGWLHPRVFSFFNECDEIWHAGDIGNCETYNRIKQFKPLRAVYGNIDGIDLRLLCNEYEFFTINNLRVLMMHIGGYPNRYSSLANTLIHNLKPMLFISGHSHILKIIPDKENKLLHINPGAAGNYGQHQIITLIKFSINDAKITDLEILEIPRK